MTHDFQSHLPQPYCHFLIEEFPIVDRVEGDRVIVLGRYAHSLYSSHL